MSNDYWDYWLYPKLKAADANLYIYPQSLLASLQPIVLEDGTHF
jgi:hypothetical protein